jgi:hypothetical protein
MPYFDVNKILKRVRSADRFHTGRRPSVSRDSDACVTARCAVGANAVQIAQMGYVLGALGTNEAATPRRFDPYSASTRMLRCV